MLLSCPPPTKEKRCQRPSSRCSCSDPGSPPFRPRRRPRARRALDVEVAPRGLARDPGESPERPRRCRRLRRRQRRCVRARSSGSAGGPRGRWSSAGCPATSPRRPTPSTTPRRLRPALRQEGAHLPVPLEARGDDPAEGSGRAPSPRPTCPIGTRSTSGARSPGRCSSTAAARGAVDAQGQGQACLPPLPGHAWTNAWGIGEGRHRVGVVAQARRATTARTTP